MHRPGKFIAVLDVPDEHLQAALDAAWRHFGDPSKVERIPAPKAVKPAPKGRR